LNLTLFDLDGTLLPGDSDHAFGEFLVQLGWADPVAHRAGNDHFYAQYLAGTLDIDAYVDFATGPWRARPAAELQAAQQRFIDEVVRPDLHPAAQALVQRHRAAGDQMALVTATNAFVTAPIAQLFGFETLIATDLQRDTDGGYTGRIAGTPSFREGKIVRVQAWLAGRGQSLADFERCTFYSDSTNDLPLLEFVSHPVATNPGQGLRSIAQQRGWPVLDLFT
jgi:HAD superfamily hydrolase (TIGR01490 family)